MANIALIKVLRERTGAGMMDCKNALVACNDDVDKACDWLREKGIAKQAKKADRIAAEGLVLTKVCEKCKKIAISEVNCETDFVANSDAFKELVNSVNETALENSELSFDELKEKVAPLFTDAAVKLGEKLSLRRTEVLSVKEGEGYCTYVHGQGKIAVVVILAHANDELAKGIALSICSGNPKYISISDVPAEVVAKEREVQVAASKEDPKLQGKPEAALAKIIEGKLHKVFSEVSLEDKEYILDPSKTVAQALKEDGNKVLKFVRFQVGEGLEKRVDNFAEEVMAQAK